MTSKHLSLKNNTVSREEVAQNKVTKDEGVVLVTGVTGQLGHDVAEVLERRGIPYKAASRADFSLESPDETYAYVKELAPRAVIHCGAYTAVDLAESQKDIVETVNATSTREMARACREVGAKLLFVSTDYVFSGEGGDAYEVDDPKAPQNAYGLSKLHGEEAVQELLERYFIVRISWVFGEHGKNFVKTMLRLSETNDALSIVSDQIGSPTYTKDVAPLLVDMIETEGYGIYHATNEGFTSWAGFAREIFRLAGKRVEVSDKRTVDYPTPAKRPLNSRLSKRSLDEAGFSRLPTWQDALARYLAK